MDLDVEVPQVVLVGDRADSRNPVSSVSRQCARGRADGHLGWTDGSAMRRSVSLMMRFGRVIFADSGA